MHQIKNNSLSIGVQPDGAELCSIKDLDTNTEYIWQANPGIWGSHAPNLFPIVGLLKDQYYLYEGKKYSLPKHGFIRYNKNILLRERSETSLYFGLNYSGDTLEMYPFKFDFGIGFSLEGRSLHISHDINNLGDNPMYFSLGGHPAFKVPLYEKEVYEEYYLEFDQKQDLHTYVLSKEGLVTGKTSVVIENDDTIQLHKNLFDKDALIFKNIPSKKVSLKSKNSGTILTLSYKDFKNLGIWAKPGANFVCIEPWLGISDLENTTQDIKTKEGIIELMPSQTFNALYTITIA